MRRRKTSNINDLVLLVLSNSNRLSCLQITVLITDNRINKGIKQVGVYPHLRQLESKGLIEIEWEAEGVRAIKKYFLTEKGEERAEILKAYYRRLIGGA